MLEFIRDENVELPVIEMAPAVEGKKLWLMRSRNNRARNNEDRPCARGSILTLSSHDPLRAVTVAEGNLQAAAFSASAATVNGPLTEKKLGSAMAQFWTRGIFTDGSRELRRRSASSVMFSELSAKTI